MAFAKPEKHSRISLDKDVGRKDRLLRTSQGFTLLELIIIILIIGILSVMPFVNWPGSVVNLDAQAEMFASDIRYAQSLAMAKAQRYRVVRTSATAYQILNSTGSPVIFASASTTRTLNTGLSFSSWGNLTNNLIAFDGRGTPYLNTAIPGTALVSGTSYIVTLTDGSNNKTVTIYPITGGVLVQ